MKVLSREDFDKAVKYSMEKKSLNSKKETEIHRARKIFHNLTDKNISDSYEIYQNVLQDDITANVIEELVGQRYRNEIDHFLHYFKKERPRCPECGANLRIGFLNNHPSNMMEEYKTYWYCEQNNPKMCEDGKFPNCEYVGDFTKLNHYELAAETIANVVEKVKKGCKGCGK